jgi:(S)-coclaurine N-methyltransferase
MKADSLLFIHYFCHAKYVYRFETEGASNWMGRYFFTGGTMLSDDLLHFFQKHLQVIDRWRVDGRHYAQTSECWLQNMDRNINEIRPILKSTYGESDAVKWEAYWRTFFMSVAELFGYSSGSEWFVAHYLFSRRSS